MNALHTHALYVYFYLQENVFAIIVCIQLRTPLIIVGPPGSSKTLSFQIVQQNVLNDQTVRESTVIDVSSRLQGCEL